jgi:hypothetical protein
MCCTGGILVPDWRQINWFKVQALATGIKHAPHGLGLRPWYLSWLTRGRASVSAFLPNADAAQARRLDLEASDSAAPTEPAEPGAALAVPADTATNVSADIATGVPDKATEGADMQHERPAVMDGAAEPMPEEGETGSTAATHARTLTGNWRRLWP